MNILIALGIGVVLTALMMIFVVGLIKLIEFVDKLSFKYGVPVTIFIVMTIAITIRVYLELI